LGDHCNVLAILEWTCEMFSSSCNVKTVRKLVEVLNDIAADIGKIREFESYIQSPDGCMDFSYIYRTFNISWDKSEPTPDDPDDPSNGVIPMTPTEKFYDSIPASQQQPLRDLMGKWAPSNTAVIRSDCVNCTEADAVPLGEWEGKFGFKLDILEDFPAKLITIILGGNVAMFSVSFPQASFSYGITWTIPVWNTPYVAVNIHASASVGFQPPSVALMSNAIIDTVKTKNPSYLFRNLAVSTTTSFATGTFEVDGGAEAGLNVIIGKLTVNFDITVKFIIEARVANFDGTDWATFDTILMQVHKYGFNGAIQFRLELRGGFHLYLQGCVNVLFWKNCWTIVSWSWDTTLWSWEPKNDLIQSVANDNGEVNVNSFDFTYPVDEPSSIDGGASSLVRRDSLRTYIITDGSIMFMPPGTVDGNAGMTRVVSETTSVSFPGMPCSAEYNILINGNLQSKGVSLPSCSMLNINISQMGYRTVEEFNISSSAFTPLNCPALTIQTCGSLAISKPMYGTRYTISGVPACPTTLDTDYGSTVNLTGNSQAYMGTLTVTGALSTIYMAMKCSDTTVTSTSINCDGAIINFPETVSVITLSPITPKPFPPEPQPQPQPQPVPDPQRLNISIEEVPLSRTVQVIATLPNANIKVPKMDKMSGFVSVVANAADDNFIHIDMDTPSDRDIVATAYPTHFSYDDSDTTDTHTIRHSNVNIRSYKMNAYVGRKSTMRLIAPDSYESVSVDMIGAKDAVLRHEISGCDRRSDINVSMFGEGVHTVVLGVDGTLDDIQCSVRVFGDLIGKSKRDNDNSIHEILVNASLDSRPLTWTFTDAEFSVSNSLDTSDIFHVYTNGLDHVTIHFSSKNANTIVFNKADTDGVEYLFAFPEDTGDFCSVQILNTQSPILMKGPVTTVVLGDPAGSVNPLSQIGAVVVAPTGSNIIMNGAKAKETLHMTISDNCVSDQQAASVPKPSDWFIDAVKDLGIDFKEGCNILVPKTDSQSAGFSTTFDITASSGDDSLDAVNSAVNVVANMGDGDDVVNWLSPDSTSAFFLQMGSGADTLSVQSNGPVNVDLGQDDKPDRVVVVCKDASPSIVHSSVFPIGVAGSKARLEISQWDSADTIEIARYSLVPPSTRDTAYIEPDVIGAQIKYQQNDNTDYHVNMCPNRSSIAFTTSFHGFGRAKNTNIEIDIPDYSTECSVSADGAENSNGSVMIGVGSSSSGVPSGLTMSTGSAVFGNLKLGLSNVDHLGVSINSAYTNMGTVTIAGAPVKKDIFVNLLTWKTVVSEDVKDIVVMTANGNAEAKNFDVTGDGMLITLGTKASSSRVDFTSTSMKDITMTNGCVVSSKKKVLSDWLIARAKSAGFELKPEQQCSALFKGVRYFDLNGNTCKTARLSGLGWDTVRSAYISTSVEKVILEDTLTESKDSLWTGATLTDQDFMVSKKNEDAFHVSMYNPKGTMEVGSAVFAPSAKFFVNCSDSKYHMNWNVALDKKNNDSPLRSYYTDMNFTTNGLACSGRINSRVLASSGSAPSINLIRGIGASVFVEISGSKNATLFERLVDLSSSDGMNRLHLNSFDHYTDEVDFVWDASLSGNTTLRLSDRSENAIVVNHTITKKHPLYITAGVHSALSFPNYGNNTISFDGVVPAHFNTHTSSFDLLGGESSSDVLCFSPCDMCSSDTWDEIRVLGKPCSIENLDVSTCSKNAHIHVSQDSVDALISLSCGKASWDPTKQSAGCGIAFNANGAAGEYTNVIPAVCKVIAAILVFVAGVASVLGASVLISRISVALGKTAYPEIKFWWMSNIMRDFLNDQFSWASIVLTACLGSVSNYDISNWGGPIDGLVIEVKSLVLDWLNFCDSVYSPILIISWVAAFVVLVLRIVNSIRNRMNSRDWNILQYLTPIHSFASSATLLLLPFVGYAIPILMKVNVFAGIVTLIFALAIIASVPMMKFNAVNCMRIIASYVVVCVPFLTSLVAGIGASRGFTLAMLLVCSILLPICNTFVLWKSYFAGADTRTKAWKLALFWSFGLRAASLICGVIFLSTLFFNLSAIASGFAYAFWFLWVVIPIIQIIPLVAGTTASNIVLRDFRANASYRPIGETTPLFASSMPSVNDEAKTLSEIATA